MIKLLFLVLHLVAATYLAKGRDLKNRNASQTSQRQVIQVLMKFFCELARKLILESFDQKM